MGLLDALLGGNSAQAQARVGWKDFVQAEDGNAGVFDTEALVYGAILGAGVRSRIWEMDIPAQQECAWGYGTAGLPANQGYMWFVAMLVATGYDEGQLFLMIENHNRTVSIPVVALPDSQLHLQDPNWTPFTESVPVNRNDMMPLPEKREFPTVHEDSRLALDYLPRVIAGAEDRANFRIPITRYY